MNILDNLKKYGDYYNESRSIPSIFDGLKPVQRKILFSTGKLSKGNIFTKCVAIQGETSKIYMHGDNSLESSLFRMGQEFKSGISLFDTRGNWGSVEGLTKPRSGAAAIRYVEARLNKLGQELYNSTQQGIVPMVDNFNGTIKEPRYLWIGFPVFLSISQKGIGVGKATNYPAYSVESIIKTTKALIENKDAPLQLELNLGSYPATVVNKSDLPAFLDGEKTLRLRAKFEIKGNKLLVTNLPVGVCSNNIINQLGGKVEVFQEITGIASKSEVDKQKNVKMVLEITCKKGSDIPALITKLCLHTSCENYIVNNLTLLDRDFQSRKFTTREALLEWIEIYEEKTIQKFQFLASQHKLKIEELEGLLKALGEIDEIIALIRNSQDKGVAKQELMNRSYSEIQADKILSMRLSSLTKLGATELQDLLNTEVTHLEKCNKIINDKDYRVQEMITHTSSFNIFKQDIPKVELKDDLIVKADKIKEVVYLKIAKGKVAVSNKETDYVLGECVVIQGDTVYKAEEGLKADLLLGSKDKGRNLITVGLDNTVKSTAVRDLLASRKVQYTKQKLGGIQLDAEYIDVETNVGVVSVLVDIKPSGKGGKGVKVVNLRPKEVISKISLVDTPSFTVKDRNRTTNKRSD